MMDSSAFLTPTEMYKKAKAAGQTTWMVPVQILNLPCDCLECAEQYRSVEEQQSKIIFLYAGQLSGSETASLARHFVSVCSKIFRLFNRYYNRTES